MRGSIFSVIVKLRVAIAHTVLAKFCAVKSSTRAIDAPHNESMRLSFFVESFAHDHMTFAKLTGSNSEMRATDESARTSSNASSMYIILEHAHWVFERS